MIGKHRLRVNVRLYIGTYTRGTASEGIYTCNWDPESGRFSELTLAAESDNPSFVIVSSGSLLAVNECDDYQEQSQGALSAFRITGERLTPTAMLPSHGAAPCHLAVHGDEVAVVNYDGGTVAIFHLDNGVPRRTRRVIRYSANGPHPRQKSAHPHGVYHDEGELLVPDLGGDRIHRLRASTGHCLAPIVVEPGSGPRHLATSTGRRLYVVNELANTVDFIERGRVVQTVTTLPPDANASSITAEIALDPDRGRLYVSNRGHDSIVAWPVDAASGRLGEPAFQSAGGAHPRHFLLVTGTRWLLAANRDSNNVAAIALTAEGGFDGIAETMDCPAPVCLALSGCQPSKDGS